MSVSRLQHACDSGLVEWPNGPVVAWRPEPGLRGLPVANLTVVHGNKAQFDAWRAQGVSVETGWTGTAAASFVQIPRSKVYARKLVAEAAAAVSPGGRVVVDGQKTDGIESVVKDADMIKRKAEIVLDKTRGFVKYK